MAGNKVNTKSKGKEDKSKSNNRGNGQTNEENELPDYALLRKPILTSITSFGQARKIFDLATEELKNLLSNECDILYECKVCRNIFRSLANFVSHKRVYCKEKFSTTIHGHFVKATSALKELMKIKHLEEEYQESLKESVTEDAEQSDSDERIPLSKDLTEIVEKIAHKNKRKNKSEETQVVLQKIPNSSVAVFQTVEEDESSQNDNIQKQVKEIEKITSRDVAVLQSDGNFTIQRSMPHNTENVIQISDDENDDTGVLKCKTCDLQFSTLKTLKFHMKYKHLESRLVYPCPDCLEIFSTSWSVYRHLFKVHRKTAAQIRRLRESIQSKAFRMNNPPASYERRKNNAKAAAANKISEEERIDQENQAWMDNMEGDGEVPRCGGCGRAFERRAALAAHTHTCLTRTRALAAIRRTDRADSKRIEIQIRKDYNKGEPSIFQLPLKPVDADENKVVVRDEAKEEINGSKSPQIEEQEKEEEEEEKEADESMEVSEEEREPSESPEKTEERPRNVTPEPIIRLPFAQHLEKSNLMALKQKIKPHIEMDSLLCKKCETKFNNAHELFDHAASHHNWMRYACKLCNFKHYCFENLPEHVKVVHKLKGDKDFVYSTVKAINGPEALEMCRIEEDSNISNDTSPDSRRPSRCSSDSSRLSDDSSSSSTRVEIGTRKRKLHHSKIQRRREPTIIDNDETKEKESNTGENVSPSKIIEENSSDIDDASENLSKKQKIVTTTVASRRPVRRRTKRKNEDFEYDLSNLLKMEAQGYRDSQSVVTTKANQTKKKIQEPAVNYDSFNKECSGAFLLLCKKSVEKSAAHMKITNFPVVVNVQKERRLSNIFVRPLLPKSVPKNDKTSPKKDKETDSSPTIESVFYKSKDDGAKITEKVNLNQKESVEITSSNKDQQNVTSELSKNSVNVPPLLPVKFRRQSLEVINNPLINKNIKDFTKAGMKTKILVIKPIKNQDSAKGINTPLKFQTIKLKDANKQIPGEEKMSDQVVVVKVPKVPECALPRPTAELASVNEIAPVIPNSTTNSDKSDDNKNISPNNFDKDTVLKIGESNNKISSIAETKCAKQSDDCNIDSSNTNNTISKQNDLVKVVSESSKL